MVTYLMGCVKTFSTSLQTVPQQGDRLGHQQRSQLHFKGCRLLIPIKMTFLQLLLHLSTGGAATVAQLALTNCIT